MSLIRAQSGSSIDYVIIVRLHGLVWKRTQSVITTHPALQNGHDETVHEEEKSLTTAWGYDCFFLFRARVSGVYIYTGDRTLGIWYERAAPKMTDV